MVLQENEEKELGITAKIKLKCFENFEDHILHILEKIKNTPVGHYVLLNHNFASVMSYNLLIRAYIYLIVYCNFFYLKTIKSFLFRYFLTASYIVVNTLELL